jgi:hypothetical protein
MSFAKIGDILAMTGFIAAICFFYRIKIKEDAPKGFCLFILRVITLSFLIVFSSALLAVTILDKEVQQTILKIAFITGLVGFFSIIFGNFFNCGNTRA